MKNSWRISAAVLLIILLGAVFALTSRDFLKLIFPLRYVPEIRAKSAQYGLDPYLALAVIRVESNFKPTAKSAVDARGLMQILPETGKWIAEMKGVTAFDPETLFEPEINVDYGCWYLDYLLEMFNTDLHLTLAAYNAGLGRVRQWLVDEKWDGKPETVHAIPFPETRLFIRKVLTIRKMYQLIYPDLFAKDGEEQSDEKNSQVFRNQDI